MNGLEKMGRKESWDSITHTLLARVSNFLVGFISGYSALFSAVLPLVAVYRLVVGDYVSAVLFLLFAIVFMAINAKIQR